VAATATTVPAPAGRARWTRLIPVAVIVYVISFMDRTNIGFAFDGMGKDLHLDAAAKGLAGGIFFIGYLVLQIPGGHLAERWSAKKFVGIMILIWGVLAKTTIGGSYLVVGAIVAIPYLFAIVGLWINARSADRTGRYSIYVMASLTLGAVALVLSVALARSPCCRSSWSASRWQAPWPTTGRSGPAPPVLCRCAGRRRHGPDQRPGQPRRPALGRLDLSGRGHAGVSARAFPLVLERRSTRQVPLPLPGDVPYPVSGGYACGKGKTADTGPLAAVSGRVRRSHLWPEPVAAVGHTAFAVSYPRSRAWACAYRIRPGFQENAMTSPDKSRRVEVKDGDQTAAAAKVATARHARGTTIRTALLPSSGHAPPHSRSWRPGIRLVIAAW
jgi:Major Facilitator Superfamily